jgi:hypothetical protein
MAGVVSGESAEAGVVGGASMLRLQKESSSIHSNGAFATNLGGIYQFLCDRKASTIPLS